VPKAKLFIVLNGKDTELLRLFGEVGITYPLDNNVVEAFCRLLENSISKDDKYISSRLDKCKQLIATLNEFLYFAEPEVTRRVVAFPSPEDHYIWNNPQVKSEHLQEFLASIKQ
jgi:hypothetical protein